MHRVVLDTNIIFSGLYSTKGASYRILSMLDRALFEYALSVPLVLEYEAVCKRGKHELGLSEDDIDTVIDYICAHGTPFEIHFLWRPMLKDPKDDMVLELAVTAEVDAIVTFNKKDFKGVAAFGIDLVSPGELVRMLEKKR